MPKLNEGQMYNFEFSIIGVYVQLKNMTYKGKRYGKHYWEYPSGSLLLFSNIKKSTRNLTQA